MTGTHADSERVATAAGRYLDRYLREAPLAVALWRSAEATALSAVDLPRPILDIGCGFGEFGRMFFSPDSLPEVGIDINRGELLRAAAESHYRSLALCDARRIPLVDSTMASVISISSLEHIPDVGAVLAEAARVLRPGGTLAYTVPIDEFDRCMLGYRVLGAANRRLGAAYAGRVNRLLTHVNIWPPSRWVDLTQQTGLHVEQVHHLLSPSATACYELLLPLALASRAWRVAFRRRPPHPAAFRRLVAGPMQSLLTQPSPRGSNILVVASKA